MRTVDELLFFSLFGDRSYCVAQAVLQLELISCLSLPSAEIVGMCWLGSTVEFDMVSLNLDQERFRELHPAHK